MPAKVTKSIKELLDAEPKVKVRLLPPKDKRDDNFVPVCINGYIYQVMKGGSVEVPKPVADLLEEGGYI